MLAEQQNKAAYGGSLFAKYGRAAASSSYV